MTEDEPRGFGQQDRPEQVPAARPGHVRASGAGAASASAPCAGRWPSG